MKGLLGQCMMIIQECLMNCQRKICSLFTIIPQTLCVEPCKFYNNLSQAIFSELFVENHINYNLHSQSDFVIPKVKTVYKGFNSIWYIGNVIWNLMLKEIKYSDSLDSFTCKTWQCKPNSCFSRSCKHYTSNIGFITSTKNLLTLQCLMKIPHCTCRIKQTCC